ncbi:MAG: hypothetical protein HOV66_25695 [Streptomycetaceae bacterium]|jgi:hypothetical protein|nr:hypothetical protein [Streptomycetaceae bacterium]NUS58214.1 hypothetical protein [Streptomycetaceae bacterium]
MADQPPGQNQPTPGATGTAPGSTPGTPAGTPQPGLPNPRTGKNPDPQNPAYLPGIDPARAVDYTVDPSLLMPAASRADADGDALQGLSRGLALGMPAGLPGFQTGWQAGMLADAWAHQLDVLAQAAHACATKIRATTEAYFRAESANSSTLR